MANHIHDNKRIAKNTLMLYVRMFMIILVTFYSFRVLLSQLGETGYGTYNAVAGVIILFSFLSNALTQSTQRFLSFYLGKEDKDMLSRVFSMSINVHIVICLVLLFLSETIGLWFLNTYMNFPEGMHTQVNILYQMTILTFCIQVMNVPYQAVIISHEKMSFYAYFSITEVMLKFSAVLILFLFDESKIVIYGIALAGVALIVLLCYRYYCIKNFEICKYHFNKDGKLFKELISFSGWNMLGGIGNVGASQGINILFNVFCNVLVNAAMGIANQIGGAVASFVSNFQTAFNPQIIKSYANGEREYFNSLVFRCSRVSFLLIFTIGFPVILVCPTVLDLWLGEYPAYAIPFTRLMIVFCMIDGLSGPLWTSAQASGNIKTYMIIISSMIFSNVPAALLLLWLGYSPVWVIAYKVVMNLCIHFTRIGYLHWLIKFPAMEYLRKVMGRVVLFLACVLPLPIYFLSFTRTLTSDIMLILLSVSLSIFVGFYVLMTPTERQYLTARLKAKLK